MPNIWMTTAEVKVQPGDMPSGDTLGFMKVTMWACSHEDFTAKLEAYFAKYDWELLSTENTEVADPSRDYGNELNQMIEETAQDRDAVRLGTYFSYRPE
jgi:hypothetical protein